MRTHRRDYTICLSDTPPHQTSYPGGMAYATGDEATIFFRAGSWGYCLHGIGDTGLAYECDDETGFASPQEAEAAAREDYLARLNEY